MKLCVAAAVCGQVLSWIIATPRLSMPNRLFWIARRYFWSVLQQTAVLIVDPWGKKPTSRMSFLTQNIVHMFWVEVFCLNFVSVGDKVCLHCIASCFDLGVSCDTEVSSFVTTWLKKFSLLSPYHVRKSNVPACCFNLCSSVSNFATQIAHNFWNSSLSDTISWRNDHEIWGNAGKRT